MSPAPPETVAEARLAAQRVVGALRAHGGEVVTAESLTAGLVSATLAEIPGVSEWLRGGAVVYSHEMKTAILGVDAGRLARDGAVTEAVAAEMATGVLRAFGGRWSVSTTGIAGPGPSDGQPAGKVWVAAADARTGAVLTRTMDAPGDRDAVRWAACGAALGLLADLVEQNPDESS